MINLATKPVCPYYLIKDGKYVILDQTNIGEHTLTSVEDDADHFETYRTALNVAGVTGATVGGIL